jgi:hypothetical protein
MMDYLKADEALAFAKLHNWAVHNAISYTIEYEESSDRWEITASSPAPSECATVSKYKYLRDAVRALLHQVDVQAADEKRTAQEGLTTI